MHMCTGNIGVYAYVYRAQTLMKLRTKRIADMASSSDSAVVISTLHCVLSCTCVCVCVCLCSHSASCSSSSSGGGGGGGGGSSQVGRQVGRGHPRVHRPNR